VCLIVSTTFSWNVSHSMKNWARYNSKCILVFTLSTRYSCPILMELYFSQQYSSTKFHEILSIGSRFVPYGRTDTTNLIIAYRNFANAPNNDEWKGRPTTKKDIFTSHVMCSFVLQMMFRAFYFLVVQQPYLDLGPPHCWCFDIAHRRAALGGTSLGQGSALRRDLYFTAHNANLIQLL
jgi:hypothetical protein